MTISELLDQLHEAAKQQGVDLGKQIGDDEDITMYALRFLLANLDEKLEFWKEEKEDEIIMLNLAKDMIDDDDELYEEYNV